MLSQDEAQPTRDPRFPSTQLNRVPLSHGNFCPCRALCLFPFSYFVHLVLFCINFLLEKKNIFNHLKIYHLKHIVRFSLNLNTDIFRSSQVGRDIDLYWIGDEILHFALILTFKNMSLTYSLSPIWGLWGPWVSAHLPHPRHSPERWGWSHYICY